MTGAAQGRSTFSKLPVGVAPPELTIPGVGAAACEIAETVRAGGRLAVFCDYDPDGTCGGEVLRLALAGHVMGISYSPEEPGQLLFGYASASRGFGLDSAFVEAAASAGVRTLITVDCGSASTAAVALAQTLVMRVVVTDHHEISSDNSAEHHLNPARWGSSNASGSVVAFKLALALAEELDGGPTPLLLSRGAAIAAFGARSDWMDMSDPENVALVAAGEAHPPPGLCYLARILGYSTFEEAFAELDALLNLPKRTPRAKALWSARILAADSAAAARGPAAALLKLNACSETMLADLLAAAGEPAARSELVTVRLRLPGCEDFTGHAGNVAYQLSLTRHVPALVFIYAGADGFGGDLWRWAARNTEGPSFESAFTDDLVAIRAASTVMTAAGPLASAGGHPRAVSGRCSAERVEAVIAVFEHWARTHARRSAR